MRSPDPGLDLAKRHQRNGAEEIRVQEPDATWKRHLSAVLGTSFNFCMPVIPIYSVDLRAFS